MQTIIVALLSILTIMETFAQNITTDRQPVAAGRFYPADKKILTSDLTTLFKLCKKPAETWNVRAIISPHAGYSYSGRISASAFSAIPQNAVYKNIFIIGSSHVMYFDGASVYNRGDYITPLGKATVNKEIANKLISENKVFKFPVDAHINEHSIENQVPFIQYYFKDTPPIIPIIIGTDNENTVKKIAEALRPYFVPENLFIISSDFSHYPGYTDAIVTDRLTANSIISGNAETFLTTLQNNASKQIPGLVTSMCGWTSGLALLDLTNGNKEFEIKLVDYCNSGDSPDAGKKEVVGYNAIAVIDKNENKTPASQEQTTIAISESEKKQLFKIVKNTIEARLFGHKQYVPDERSITDNLKKPLGAFVTLKIDGSLKGCIGRFVTTEPLYKVVQESAISSAFEDPRFYPLTKDEFKNTSIEITVLGPLKKIKSIDEIVLGKHGIYIKKGNMEGTMLPQVATENGWTVEQFLGVTSKEKAGFGWDGWKDADIYIYEGIVLEEKN
jgi:MEMO1 family protein